MSNNKKDDSYLEKLTRLTKERREAVKLQELEDIPKSSQKLSIIIHVFSIAIFILLALTNMQNNWLQLFMCVYLTVALIWLANKYKDRTHVPTHKATRVILMATVAGLALGVGTYHTAIGESLQQKQLDAFFETNKALVGQEYYDMYVKNKDNMDELKILRQRINDDLAL